MEHPLGVRLPAGGSYLFSPFTLITILLWRCESSPFTDVESETGGGSTWTSLQVICPAIVACFLPRAAALKPYYASPGVPSDACYKCKCLKVPLKCRGLGGTQTSDFHQVITPGDPAARGIRTDLEKLFPGPIHPYQWLDPMLFMASLSACGSPVFHAPRPWVWGGNAGRGNMRPGGGSLECTEVSLVPGCSCSLCGLLEGSQPMSWL